MLTALPPRPITSDKSEAATSEVATALIDEPPAPPPPPASDVTGAALSKVATALAASHPASVPPVPVDAPASGSAKGRRGGWVPRHPCRVENPQYRCPNRNRWFVRSSPKPLSPKRELAKQDVVPPKQDTSPQATEQARGGSGPWRAMALAPADKPVLKVPTARPKSRCTPVRCGPRWPGISRAPACGSAMVACSIGRMAAAASRSRAPAAMRGSMSSHFRRCGVPHLIRRPPRAPPPTRSASISNSAPSSARSSLSAFPAPPSASRMPPGAPRAADQPGHAIVPARRRARLAGAACGRRATAPRSSSARPPRPSPQAGTDARRRVSASPSASSIFGEVACLGQVSA